MPKKVKKKSCRITDWNTPNISKRHTCLCLFVAEFGCSQNWLIKNPYILLIIQNYLLSKKKLQNDDWFWSFLYKKKPKKKGNFVQRKRIVRFPIPESIPWFGSRFFSFSPKIDEKNRLPTPGSWESFQHYAIHTQALRRALEGKPSR